MAGDRKSESATCAAKTDIGPRQAFSKSTSQTVWICAVLFALLVLWIYVVGAPPQTVEAMLADVLLGALVAVFGIGVVGGTIEWKSSVRGIGKLKVTGGLAIIILVGFQFRPIYSVTEQIPYQEHFRLSGQETIGAILELYEHQYSTNVEGAIDLKIPNDAREEIMRFRTAPVGTEIVFSANWGFWPRNPKLRVLDQIEDRQNCLSFVEDDKNVIAKLDRASVIRARNGGINVYLCEN